MGLEFRVLGPLEVIEEGEQVAVAGRTQRTLLATLLLQPGRVVSTDRLVFDLWGEEPPRAAVPALHNAVAKLRKQIGAEMLERRSPGYVLGVAQEQIDAHRFESALTTARKAGVEER